MIGYKALYKNFTSAIGSFKYVLGKTYELPKDKKLEICRCGFHFCENPIDVYGYYENSSDTIIVEVEALGEIIQEGTKYVTDKIKIIRVVYDKEELQNLIARGNSNSGDYNTGNYNTGDYNSGNCNSSNYNSGNCNTGDRNSGNYNTGNTNTGNYNTGNSNSGHHNSGHCNNGHGNTGHYNEGDFNDGDHNSGDHNTGCRNEGNYNTANYNFGHHNAGSFNRGAHNAGWYNSGERNTGIFNTGEPLMRAFNKECDMTFTEFLESLEYQFYDLCIRIYNKKLEKGDRERIEALPNYDPDIFTEITGIKFDDCKNDTEKEECNIVDAENTNELIASLFDEIKSLREEIKQLKNKEE